MLPICQGVANIDLLSILRYIFSCPEMILDRYYLKEFLSLMRGTSNKRSELRKLIQQVIEKYQPDKIILFGSYAYGNPDENSDADILIIKETDNIPFHRQVKLRKLCQVSLYLYFQDG